MAERPTAAVLGLGLTGASLALALKQCGLFRSVVAWDPDFDVARNGQRAGAGDRFVKSAAEAARGAEIVFVALRGEALSETLTALGPNLKVGAVVCNTLEGHETANAVASRTLPGNVSFINADPVAWEVETGREAGDGPAGRGNAKAKNAVTAPSATPSAGRFEKGAWCISSLPAAHEDAVGFVVQVGERLGMEAVFLDAREHDALVAGLHALPAVLSAALLQVASGQSSWREMGRLAGMRFREATSLAAGDPDDVLGEAVTSREHLVRWLDLLVAELTRLRTQLEDETDEEVASFFTSASAARAKWLHERDLPAIASDLPQHETKPRRRFPF